MFPILFHIYGFEVHTYPIVIVMGLLITSLLIAQICFKRKMSLDFFSKYLPLLILGTFLGARMGGVIESWDVYEGDFTQMLYILDGNYNFFSAYLFFFITFSIVCKIKKENLWIWLDSITPPFLILFAFIALANFLAGKNYGIPSELLFAMTYNIPEVRYTIPIHPIQLYELAGIFVILVFLKIFSLRKRFKGMIFSIGMVLLFTMKAFLTFLTGSADTLVFEIKLSLILSCLFTFSAFTILIFRSYPKIRLFHHKA